VREAVLAMTTQGFNPTSINSLVTQLVRRGFISRDKDSRLTALITEYVAGHAGRKPGSKNIKPKPEPKKEPVRLRRQAPAPTGLAALHAAPAPTSLPAPRTTVDDLMDSLSIGQAHALYLKLHKMFGG
jgi:hypothetical protein